MDKKPFVERRPPPLPDSALPPGEYAKAAEEYEAAMKQYMNENIFGASYEDNPEYIAEKPRLDAQWEAVKDLIL